MIQYNENVINYFFNRIHAGLLAGDDKYQASAKAGSEHSNGYFMIALRCNNCGIIQVARYKAYGNPYLLAGLEILCENMENTPLNSHPQFDFSNLSTLLELPKKFQYILVLLAQGYERVIAELKKTIEV